MSDLIDRNALCQAIYKEVCALNPATYEELNQCEFRRGALSDMFIQRGLNLALLHVRLQPEVEPEQKHGRWVETKETVWTAKEIDEGKQTEIAIVSAKCSVCQKWADEVNTFPPRMHYKYCPNCNAIMDGGTENV